MYNQFFGFQERPFKLVPNPAYLYLSKSHQEALAHLRYAVTDGEGFVEITGDVGTGKTLLCRTFLEGLGSEVDSAYIFNPRMDGLDLLKAINDEFGVPSDFDSKKDMVDALNAFLMRKKAESRRVILLIDEAQNLNAEVLEQIRLLSNLETTKDKLLQIILVGQPELSEMLDSHELRQLGQRISLSCRLQALNFQETRRYIAHRVAVAAQKPAEVFSAGAIRRIFRFSRGVPRRINIACDRALLTAYGQNRRRVNGRVARAAILELATRGDIRRETVAMEKRKVFALSALCGVLLAVLLYQLGTTGITAYVDSGNRAGEAASAIRPGPAPKASPLIGKAPSPPSPAALPAASAPSGPEPAPPAAPAAFSGTLAERMVAGSLLSRTEAFGEILKRWDLSPTRQSGGADIPIDIASDATFFSLAARQHGLTATVLDRDIHLLTALNLPVILTLAHPLDGRKGYGVAVQSSPETLTLVLDVSGRTLEIPYSDILDAWAGAVVFWRNFYDYKGIIAFNAPEESVAALKLHLRNIGYHEIILNGEFDMETQRAVKDIQARHGIPVDGFAGALTVMVMYNETPFLKIPHLRPTDGFPKTAGAAATPQKPTNGVGMKGEEP